MRIRWRTTSRRLLGAKGLLKLIEVEILKLRRRKIVWLLLLATLVMPFLALFSFHGTGQADVDAIRLFNWTMFSYTQWIILPVDLGILCTMLMFNENQYDMLKQLFIVPISKAGYFFSKFVIVLIYSIVFMLISLAASLLTGLILGDIQYSAENLAFFFRKSMEIGALTAIGVLPILAVAGVQKGYILPVCMTLVYTFLGFILLMVNMYLHPLSSISALIDRDIPGVILNQPLSIPLAFLCIGLWGVGASIFAIVSLTRRK